MKKKARVLVGGKLDSLFFVTLLILFLYGTGLVSNYHFNRLASGFFIVGIILSIRCRGLRKAAILFVLCISFVSFLSEYSRVYQGVLFAIFTAFAYKLFHGRVAGFKISHGIRLASILSMPILGIALFIAIIGSRAENLLDSFLLGGNLLASGVGFDVNYNTAWIIDNVPSSTPYLWFQNWLTLLVNPIPRDIWSEKPVAYGALLSSQLYNVHVDEIFVNLGPGLFGELYASGGFLSMALSMPLLIYCFSRIDMFFCERLNDFEYLIFYFVFVALICFIYRGDFLNGMVNLILRLLPLYLFVKIFRYR